jgi:hypothetical protein
MRIPPEYIDYGVYEGADPFVDYNNFWIENYNDYIYMRYIRKTKILREEEGEFDIEV